MTGPGDDGDDVWDPFDDGSTGDTNDPTADDADHDPPGERSREEGTGNSEDGGSAGDDDPAVGGDDADGSARDSSGGSAPEGDPSRSSDPPPPEPATDDAAEGPVSWFLNTDNAVLVTIREVVSTVGLVFAIGLLLFAVSGIYPPLVAVESGSMEPHMFKGDLVFIVENGRYAPDGANAGVVTYRQGNASDGRLSGYWSFGDHGNVVVYRPNGRGGTPIIHRARFYVEEGENWYDEADPRYVGSADNCEQLQACPAPHDGFVTKGDNNRVYDQVAGRSTVVKPEWIRGVAKVRVPWLGCIRLELSGDSCF